MKKIGLIADIHSNLAAFKAVLDDMPKMDKIICAGDLVGYGPQPNEVIDLVKSNEIITVIGNHDNSVVTEKYNPHNKEEAKVNRWTREVLTDENFNFLKDLDKKVEIKVKNQKIFVAHGTPRNPLKEYLFPGTSNRTLVKMTQEANSDIIVLGHTHIPLEEMIQGKLIINPGSVGQPRDRNPKASYKILKLGRNRKTIHRRAPYKIKKTEQKIIDSGLPEKFGNRLHFGW